MVPVNAADKAALKKLPNSLFVILFQFRMCLSKGKIIMNMNDVLQRFWKAVTIYCNLLSWHLLGQNEEKHEKNLVKMLVFGFEKCNWYLLVTE